jgi:ATPase family AAA domain-containing protein 3A/B
MSWLFGVKKQQPTLPDELQQQLPQSENQNQPLTNAEKKAMEAYRFDSSALERAAEAARTLEKSSMKFRFANDVTLLFKL